jgi:hypothetical protein
MGFDKVLYEYAKSQLGITISSIRYAFPGIRFVLLQGFLFLLLFFTVIGIPYALGHLNRCIREVLEGNRKVPHIGFRLKYYKDGLVISFLAIEYIVLLSIFIIFSLYLFNDLEVNSVTYSIHSKTGSTDVVGILGGLFEMFIFGVFFSNSWFMYMLSDKILPSINPISTAKWIIDRPKMIFNNMFTTGILGLILMIPGIFVITTPWVTYIGMVSNAYIRADSYEKWVKSGDIHKHEIIDMLKNGYRSLKNKK